jgi:hypothetical protein
LIALAPLLALLYWIRGRGWPWGTTTNRLIWAVPVGVAVTLALWLGGAPWWAGLPTVVTAFLGLVVTGHSAHMGAGRAIPTPRDGEWTETVTRWLPRLIDRSTHPALYDAIGLSVIGLVRMAVLVLPVVPVEPSLAWMTLAGLLHAPAYFLGWSLYGRTQLRDPLEWCEALWGATMGFCLGLLLS